MLSKLGQNVPYTRVNTWGKNELVYYFNSEEKIANNLDKLGNLYKMLNIIYIHPSANNYNLKSRKGTCFTYRKVINTHGKKTINIHPPNSFEITMNHTQLECINIFNKHTYFISYDSITFLLVIAALCGCVSIVKKVSGLSKQDWLNTTAACEYLKESGENTLYGIAYGRDDLQNAIKTLHLANQQWNKINEYMKQTTIIPFLDDIKNLDNIKYLENTVKNNFG